MLTFLSLPFAWGPTGLMKSTWAASDPLGTTLPALLKYLPVYSTPDSCPNNACTCGACGRTQMNGTFFGLHTVYAAGRNGCRAKPPLTGHLSIEDVEAIFDEECGDMSRYSPWMDYHAALWVPAGTLDGYVASFESDGVPLLKLSWPCFFDSAWPTCFSVIWHIPKSMVVIELASNATARVSTFRRGLTPRHIFPTNELPRTRLVIPLHDSRAVPSVEKVVRWWREVMLVEPFKIVRRDDLKMVSFAFATDASAGHNATVQYIERTPAAAYSRAAGHSTTWFADYLNGVAEKYMTSPTSFWPIWGDNHLALARNSGKEEDSIDALIERLQKRGDAMYHPFVGIESGFPGFGHTGIYVQDPSGWQVEYHATWRRPPNSTDVDTGDFGQYCDYHCG